jgi:hypothetical protein
MGPKRERSSIAGGFRGPTGRGHLGSPTTWSSAAEIEPGGVANRPARCARPDPVDQREGADRRAARYGPEGRPQGQGAEAVDEREAQDAERSEANTHRLVELQVLADDPPRGHRHHERAQPAQKIRGGNFLISVHAGVAKRNPRIVDKPVDIHLALERTDQDARAWSAMFTRRFYRFHGRQRRTSREQRVK